MPRARRADGQFIVGGVVFLGALLVVVQAMVWFARQEAVWTSKERKSTSAFYLAEAGYDRAVWKLKERAGNFDDLLAGGSLAGYAWDTEYSDVPGGAYKVWIGSGPGDQQLTVFAAGKDQASGEFRAIEAVLDRRFIVAPLISPAISVTGAATIHWGSVLSIGAMDLSGGANQLYPRKLSRGAITASGAYGNRDSNPTAPNTDGLEWWSYNQPPGVPDPVSPNLEYYKALAQSQGRYYPGASYSVSNLVDSSTDAVRYFEGNVRFLGSMHFKGVLIVLGNLEFSGAGKAPEGNLAVTPPSDAYNEYQKNTPSMGTGCGGGGGANAADDGDYSNNAAAEGDKACVDQYPGDAGLHAVEGYTIGTGCDGHGDLGGSGGLPAKFQGLVFVRGQLRAASATTLHGAVVMDDGASWGGGTLEIFYDPTLQVTTAEQGSVHFNVASWREAVPPEF